MASLKKVIKDGDGFLQERGLWDQKDSIFHVLCKKRLFPIMDVLDEREDIIPYMDEHFVCLEMLPVRPPAVFLPFED